MRRLVELRVRALLATVVALASIHASDVTAQARRPVAATLSFGSGTVRIGRLTLDERTTLADLRTALGTPRTVESIIDLGDVFVWDDAGVRATAVRGVLGTVTVVLAPPATQGAFTDPNRPRRVGSATFDGRLRPDGTLDVSSASCAPIDGAAQQTCRWGPRTRVLLDAAGRPVRIDVVLRGVS